MSCDDGRVSLVQLRKEAELGKETEAAAANTTATTTAAALPSATPTLTREPELLRKESFVLGNL